MLFGVLLTSPHASATVKSIDVEAAKKMPGVKAVLVAGRPRARPRSIYQGQEIAAVAAETEEQARDAARAIKVDYEVLPHVVTERQAMADRRPEGFRQPATPGPAAPQTRGNPEDAHEDGRRDDRGHLLAAGHHPRLPRAARPDRRVEGERLDRRLRQHPVGHGRRQRPGRAASGSTPPTSRSSPR